MPAVDEVAHGEAHVGLVGRRCPAAVSRSRSGGASAGRRHLDGGHRRAGERDPIRRVRRAGAQPPRGVGVLRRDVEARHAAAVAHQERAAVLQRAVEVDDGSPASIR